jgi:hypothetical protein
MARASDGVHGTQAGYADAEVVTVAHAHAHARGRRVQRMITAVGRSYSRLERRCAVSCARRLLILLLAHVQRRSLERDAMVLGVGC